MSKPFRYTRRVEFRDTDAAGIVHFSVFFNYMEEAEHAALRDLGLDVVNIADSGTWSFPRVAAKCNFREPLGFSDEVTIDVTVGRLGNSSVTYKFDFSRDSEHIAEGEVIAVCCRLSDDGSPESMKIPSHFAEKLATLQS